MGVREIESVIIQGVWNNEQEEMSILTLTLMFRQLLLYDGIHHTSVLKKGEQRHLKRCTRGKKPGKSLRFPTVISKFVFHRLPLAFARCTLFITATVRAYWVRESKELERTRSCAATKSQGLEPMRARNSR